MKQKPKHFKSNKAFKRENTTCNQIQNSAQNHEMAEKQSDTKTIRDNRPKFRRVLPSVCKFATRFAQAV